MWSNLRCLPSNFLNSSKCFTQPRRNTFILKRVHPPRLSSLSSGTMKKLKSKDYIYEVVENTNLTRKSPLEVVLTQNVPGIGSRGDLIKMNRYLAYRDLLLPKLAIYADSPEAKSIMKVQEDQEYSSIYCKMVENFLISQAVAITLSADTDWKLEPWHVKVALRKIGLIVENECITIPREITGPNLEIENKDFLIELTMNKKEKFYLRCRIYHWSTANPVLNKKVMDIRSPSEPLFPEEKEKIDAIIKLDLELRRKKMMSGH